MLSMLTDEKEQTQVIQTHALWDASDAHYTAHWLSMASHAQFEQSFALAWLEPNDVLTLRAEQDAGNDLRAEVCKRHRALALASRQRRSSVYGGTMYR